MAQDYANRVGLNRPTSPQHKPGKPWALILATLVVVFAAGLLVMAKRSGITDFKAFFASSSKPAKPQLSQKPKPARPAPEFDFYQTLSQPQSTAPSKTESQPAASSIEKPLLSPHLSAVSPTERAQYFLQVASFRSNADADRLKAQLVLAGFDVSLQRVHRGTNDWHRVMVGPFISKSLAHQKQKQLHALKFETLLVNKQHE